MNRSITLTGKDRPELFRSTLDSLLSNDLEGWNFVIRVEPGPQSHAFAEIVAERLSAHRVDFAVNDRVMGIRDNPLATISTAFAAGSSLNLCLEEDLVLAPDATRMALWFHANHRPHWLCLSLLAGPCASAGMISDPRYPEMLFESRSFNSLGFAVRREEWAKLIEPAWAPKARQRWKGFAGWRYHWGWDWSVYGVLAIDQTLRTVQPALARANHTGRTGQFSNAQFHDLAFGDLPLAQSGVEMFTLIPAGELPRDIRVQMQLHTEMTDMRLHLEAVAREAQAGFVQRMKRRLFGARRSKRPTLQPVGHQL